MSFDNEPDLEVGDVVRLGAHHWVGREWKENPASTRFKQYDHIRFKITGFKPWDGMKDTVYIEPMNGAVVPNPNALYGWNGKDRLRVSCVDLILVERPVQRLPD